MTKGVDQCSGIASLVGSLTWTNENIWHFAAPKSLLGNPCQSGDDVKKQTLES